MQVCHRLLPYKEDTAEMLMHSLTLIISLNASVAWDLASRIASEVSSVLQGWLQLLSLKPLASNSSRCVGHP